jgi:hypothetical protein
MPPRPGRTLPSHLRRAGAAALACGLASVAIAGNGVQWRLEAQVPVICAILAVETAGESPASLAIETSCNAERFQLRVSHEAGAAGLVAARSSAGPAQVSGSAVTVTSTRPGHARTTVELAQPVDAARVSVTLHPI